MKTSYSLDENNLTILPFAIEIAYT